MASTMKLSLTFVLLLSGLVVFGDVGDAAADCSTIRCIQGGYITCENYKKELEGCACVCAPSNGKGCVLHLQDGSTNNCTKTKWFMVIGFIQSTEAKQGKVYAMYCVEAKYMTCPLTGSEERAPACNCCLAGEKGCTIYLSNGNVMKCT